MKPPANAAVLSTAAPWRLELLAILGPAVRRAWLALAVLGLATGLGCRLAHQAPAPLTLLDGLSAALWLAACWLVPAWERLVRRYRGAAAALARTMGVAALALCALLLSLAPLGALLAYAPQAVLATARPMDENAFAITVGRLFLYVLPLAGAPLLLGGIALLTLLRGLLGTRLGTGLWLACGLALHGTLLSGVDFLGGLGPGGLGRLALAQFTSTEPQQMAQMFDPLRPWVVWAWAAALAATALSLTVRSTRLQTLSPLLFAVAGGAAAATLRTVVLALRWLASPALLSPDTALGALSTLLVATAAIWLALAPWQAPAVRERDLRGSLPWLAYAGVLALLLDLPQRLSGETRLIPALAATGADLLLLLAVLGCAALLMRAAGQPETMLSDRRSALPPFSTALLSGLLLGVLFCPLGVGAASALSLPPALFSAAALGSDQRPLSLTLAACLLGAAALPLVALRPRRYRLRRLAPPTSSALPS